jgi:hypothetical protein
VYGIAPVLVVIICLFTWNDSFAPGIANTYVGVIEFCGSLYLAGLFLWNLRQRWRGRALEHSEEMTNRQEHVMPST